MWRVRCNLLHFSCNIWGKIVFTVMYLIIKSVWVNRSDCLILYVNVVALLNIIQNELTATFVSLGVFVYPSIQVVNVRCQFTDSYESSMLSLSESKLSSLECSRVPWNATECIEIQPSATKSIIVICANAYKNIVFVHGIITWTSFHVTTIVCNATVINKTQ
jgi:hypothetical protein